MFQTSVHAGYIIRMIENTGSDYSETCLKGPLKNIQNKGLVQLCGSLMQVKNIA